MECIGAGKEACSVAYPTSNDDYLLRTHCNAIQEIYSASFIFTKIFEYENEPVIDE